MTERLLKVRATIKKRKPTFRRQQINQYAKFARDKAWRRPKGPQSKMRLHEQGHRKMPTVGFGSPKEVKGLNREGFKEVIVFNVADLKLINTKTDAVVVGAKVGGRKKLAILSECKTMKLKVSNVKDVDKKIKALTKETKAKEVKETKKVTKTETKTKEAKTPEVKEEKAVKKAAKEEGAEK